jgi:hypothetical protein
MAIGEEGEEAKDNRCCQEGKRREEFIADSELEGTGYDAFTLSIYLPSLIIILICGR